MAQVYSDTAVIAVIISVVIKYFLARDDKPRSGRPKEKGRCGAAETVG